MRGEIHAEANTHDDGNHWNEIQSDWPESHESKNTHIDADYAKRYP